MKKQSLRLTGKEFIMPDHVRFNHAPHIWYLTENPNAIQNKPVDFEVLPDGTVNASKVCSTCHGNVAGMEQVAQVQPLKWVNVLLVTEQMKPQ